MVGATYNLRSKSMTSLSNLAQRKPKEHTSTPTLLLFSGCSPHCNTQSESSRYKASEVSPTGSAGAEMRVEKGGERFYMGRKKLLSI